jgi:hypothetical protein
MQRGIGAQCADAGISSHRPASAFGSGDLWTPEQTLFPLSLLVLWVFIANDEDSTLASNGLGEIVSFIFCVARPQDDVMVSAVCSR